VLLVLGATVPLRAQADEAVAARNAAARAQIRAASDPSEALDAAKRALVFARRSDDLGARSQVAAAMLDAGLADPARTVLDDVLDADPDEPRARALVAAGALHLGVPAWSDDPARAELLRRQLVALGQSGSAVVRERVLAELTRADGRQRRVLQTELEASLRDARPPVRRFASLALRRLAPGAALSRLQRHAVLDRDDAVRVEAARALRDAHDPAGVADVATLLDEPNPFLRARAAETLAVAGYRAAVAPLVRSLLAPPALAADGSGGGRPAGSIYVGAQRSFLQGYEAEVATNAAVANPILGVVQDGASLTARVQGVSTVGGVSFSASQSALRGALSDLTGERFPSSQAWGKWWEREGRARYLDGGLEPAPETAAR